MLLDRTDFDINQVIRNTAASFEGTCRQKTIAIELVLTGDVMTMPGLPKKPAAYGIDVNEDGVITGLF